MELLKLNHRHEGVLNFLVEHPELTLTEIGEALGYSVAWLSTMLSSDMFKAKYDELCNERHEIAVHSVGARLNRLASSALEEAQKIVDSGKASENFIKSVLPSALDRTGYGTKAEGKNGDVHHHEHVHITAEGLEEAKRLRRETNRLKASLQ